MSGTVSSCRDAANRYFTERYPGYRLDNFRTEQGGFTTFYLSPLSDGVPCPECGSHCERFHDHRSQVIRDWDIVAGRMIDAVVPSRRLLCQCGYQKTEPSPNWVLPGHRITRRLGAFVQFLLRGRINNKEVQRITGVSWGTIKALDIAQLEPRFENVDLSSAARLAFDEISIEKGHSYATVVMDLERRRILWVCRGKRRVDIEPFFKALSDRGLTGNIASVSVDMNAGYPALVSEYLPDAKLAYDRFHVMQKFTREVLVEAKKESIRQARERVQSIPRAERTDEHYSRRDAEVRLLKKSEWLVITKPELLSGGKQERLNHLRECNALFRDLYPLAAQLRAIWEAKGKDEAQERLKAVVDLCEAAAENHNFKPLKRFASMLIRRAEGIVNACLVGFGTNILEGANNTAKVIKRVAYGFRDFKYFALKLKAASPGRDGKSSLKGWNLVWNGVTTNAGLPVTFPK